MASIKLSETKDGRRFFQICVSRGYGKAPYKTRFYWPLKANGEPVAEKTAEKAAKTVAAEFEAKCSSGLVLTRAQQKEKAAAEAAEAAKLKTVRQYAEKVFLPTKEITLSENARSNYQQVLSLHVFPVIGDCLLVDVTPAMIQNLLLNFQKDHAHASVVKLYNIMNGLFQMAFMQDSIPVNPMLKVKRPAPRKDEAQKEEADKAFTAAELAHILSCAAQEPLKWQVYIFLSADTGARRGELCGLQWADIDWNTGHVTFRRNLQYTPKAGVYETTLKNKRSRPIDIGPDMIRLLRQLREEQAASCISKWVFSQDGLPDPIHPQSPTRYFKKFEARYGIKDFHPHKLRHSSASIALTSGADVVSVSERLGHSDTAVTLRMYAHANEESIRRVGQIVRDALKAQT